MFRQVRDRLLPLLWVMFVGSLALGDELPAAGDDARVPDLRTRTDGSDWSVFLGPTHDSKSAERGIRTTWPTTGPPLIWTRRLGVGYGICSISRGRLFQFDRYGDRARLTCLRSETGDELWRFEYPTAYEDLYGYNNGPRCCPVIDDDRVYIYGVAGMLHCLRVVDGQLLWKVDTMQEFDVVQNFFGVGSTPLVEGDLLLVQVGGTIPGRGDLMAGTLQPNGTAVVAFDKHTGEVRYRTGDDLASYSSPAMATIGGQRCGLVWARGGLLAFDAATGKQRFHFPWRARTIESVNASNPVVVGERVFLSECYGPGSVLLQVDDAGYDVVWQDDERQRARAMQTHWNTAVHHDGYLYGSSGRHSGDAELRCIELATGEVRWSEPGLSRSSLLYVDGHFVCLTEYGDLLLLAATPEKFALVAQATPLRAERGALPGLAAPRLLKYPAWAAPILAHGLLYVRGEDQLACFELIPPPSK